MTDDTKRCPYCGEEILAVAKKCKHCHERLEDDSTSPAHSVSTIPLEDGTVPLPEIKRILGGRYELLNELGRGGMGIVYKARDTKLNTDVAIKLLPEHLTGDARGIDFLKREALASMKLSHPNILRLHHFEDRPEAKFLIMEFVNGKNLRQIQSESPNHKLSEEQVVKYAIEACNALECAHTERVIHRDIKPANMMVDAGGRLKIADFGIARIIRDSNTRHTGTISGGTLLYMSPEQIQGDRVDARSDIYSLGVSLYELLNGEAPFCSGDITHQHLSKDAPRIDGISDSLNSIILKCLEKQPEDRFQTAAELRSALQGDTVPAIGEPKKTKNVMVVAAVAVLAIIVGVGLVYALNRKSVVDVKAGTQHEQGSNAGDEPVGKNPEDAVPATPEQRSTREAVAETLPVAERKAKALREEVQHVAGANIELAAAVEQATPPQNTDRDVGIRSQTGASSPSLLGTWQGPMEMAFVPLIFESENTLVLDGERMRYSLLPGVIRIQDEFGIEDYPYSLKGDTLLITFPEGLQLQFNRTGGGPTLPPSTSSDLQFDTAAPAAPATATDVNAGPVGTDASVTSDEIGDPAWGFKFKPPAGWKSSKSAEGILLGHDTIAGAIIVIPHIAESFQEVQANMQSGLVEGTTQLYPAGGLQSLAGNAIAGEYSGMYEGAQVKARGIGTFSPYGGGAYIIGLTTPEKYGKPLAGAADSIAKQMQYFRVDISELVRHFAGEWVHLTPNTITSMTLAPNGDYIRDYEASYGGQFTDQYGFDAGNWGAAGKDSSRARWTVRGSLKQGVLIITNPDGSQDTVNYQVYVSKGETYWREYLFNGIHYRKR